LQIEIRQGFRTVPSRPIAVVLALLAVLALALTTWYVFSVSVPSRSLGNDRTNITTIRRAAIRTRRAIRFVSWRVTRSRRAIRRRRCVAAA